MSFANATMPPAVIRVEVAQDEMIDPGYTGSSRGLEDRRASRSSFSHPAS
jgi:hypothetical protein